jgi:creatinine amidohydrolase/Fe(II)-dependent formamide hydrolase-like protein
MEGHFQGDHAAVGETSFQLLFDGDLVDLDQVPQDRAPTLDDDGVWGDDPKDASAERGRRMLKAFLDHTVARMNELAAQTQ